VVAHTPSLSYLSPRLGREGARSTCGRPARGVVRSKERSGSRTAPAGLWVESGSFLALREHWRQRAVQGARALRAGDSGPARLCLSRWAFSTEPAWADGLLTSLVSLDLQPDAAAGGLWLASRLPEVGALHAGDLRAADSVYRALRARPAPHEIDPLVWALTCTAWAGHQLERGYRAPWRNLTLASEPEKDAHVAGLLRGLLNNPWGALPGWRRAYLQPTLMIFGVTARHSAEWQRVDRVVSEAREAFDPRMIGPPSSPGWVEVLVRVLELGGSPLARLAAHLDEEAWRATSQAVLDRRHHAQTALSAVNGWSDHQGVAGHLAGRSHERPERAEAFVDLHVLHRLVTRWSLGEAFEPEAVWSTALNNHRRARARLRAVLLQSDPAKLVEGAVALPNLAARMDRAVRLFARSWARQERELGFSFGLQEPVDAVCEHRLRMKQAGPPREPPWAFLRAWALDAALRGMFDDLETWVRTAAVRPEHKSRWDTHIERLRAAAIGEQAAGRSSWGAVRWVLAYRWKELAAWMGPVLQALAAAPSDRRGPAAVKAILDPCWHEGLPPRERGFKQMAEQAGVVLERLGRLER
jgi:hypothetical protein